MPETARPLRGEVIVVLGMHRSGTSLATRALRALGVSLGGNLSAESSPDNAKGHWEDRDVLAFNERLMATLALEWDVVGAHDSALMSAPSLAPMVEEARALVQSKIVGGETWAFKDPRTARLWPFWRRVFADGEFGQPDFLWSIRHPLAVAQSLARRDGFAPLKSYLLWLRHNDLPFDDVAAGRHVLVDYDRMLRSPREELEGIADGLALSLGDERAVAEFAEGFLDPGLRHFNAEEVQFGDNGLGALVARAHETLLGASGLGDLSNADFRGRWRAIVEEADVFLTAAPRVDAATVAARTLGEVETRLAEEQRREQALHAEELQKQVSETFQEQFTEVTRRMEDTDARLTENQQRQHDEFAINLQKQVTRTFQEQYATVVGRLEETDLRFAEGQRQLAVSQQQVAQSLKEQYATVVGRLEETDLRFAEGQQQLAQSLNEQSDATGRRFEQMYAEILEIKSGLQQSRADLAFANELLNRERYSVFKPVLRRAYRTSVKLIHRLPVPIQQRIRRLKRKLVPRSLSLTITIGGPLDGAAPEAGESTDTFELLEDLRSSADCLDILILPVIDWHFRFQRPQQLARHLALMGHRVFYLSTTFAAAEAPGFRVLETPAPNVALIQLALPGGHPNIYQDALTAGQRELLALSIRHLIDRARLLDLVTIVDLPFWRTLAEAIPGSLLVYDCMDYHAGFSTNSSRIIDEEARLLEQADLVITTSAGLSEIIGETFENRLIRNAGEIAYFQQKPQRLPYRSNRPVVGYLGAIADWFDIDLVLKAARRFVDWDFVLVGSTEHCDVAGARKQPNVKLIGEVPYEEAAGWVHSFDVAMIPFRLTKLTRCTNPVKAYEYLAAGKPVVATALPEMRLMGDMAHVADDRDAFVALLEVAMGERNDDVLATERSGWAEAHDWRHRAELMDAAVRGAMPKVSVVVLTYNNLDFTKACLTSLEANTRYPNWELVLVDNASTDGSREFLADYAAGNPRTRLVQIEENLGFAAGNNRGLEVATGDYLVVLNNDTYVTPGWLHDLVRHLRKDPQLGLVGAVTNNIGNEAKIDIDYADMKEMQKAAYLYTSKHPREELDVGVVAFFCVGMPRTLFEAVGGLDERFGLGFFEDDDYCKRVAQAGFRIAIAEDVFVHHHLSASFDTLDQSRRQALFDRNKALYEEKWGEWTPHRYRDNAMRAPSDASA